MTDKQLNKYIFLAVVGFGAYYFWTKNKRLNEFDDRELALMEDEADRKAKADASKKKKKKSKGYKIKPIKKKKTTTETTMSMADSMSMGSSMASSNEPITPENAPTEQANNNATQEPDTEPDTQSFVDGEQDEDGWTIGAEPSQPYIVNVSSAQGGAVKIGGLPTAMPTPMMNMDGEGNLIVNDKPNAPTNRDSANGKWNNEVLFGFDDGIEDIDEMDELYEDFGSETEDYEDFGIEDEDYDYTDTEYDAKRHFDNKSKLNFDLDE
jgi:hypothetical protein